MNKPMYPEIKPESVVIPKDKTLASWLDSRIARYETRGLDWDALKFQADFDPKYRRAQMRYVGQTYEVDTPLPGGVITKVHIPEITRAFHAAHEHEYGVSSDDFPVAFVALGVGAVGELKQPPVFNFAGQKSKPSTTVRPERPTTSPTKRMRMLCLAEVDHFMLG
jgi:N-methylhydantoinase A/oxoprolinase/acetone carboxylase beta subunit